MVTFDACLMWMMYGAAAAEPAAPLGSGEPCEVDDVPRAPATGEALDDGEVGW